MSADTGGSWSVGLELSAELLAARLKTGKSRSDVGKTKIASSQKLWRMETGIGPWKVSDITALCLLYGVADERRFVLEEMARASTQDTWTEKFASSSPPRFGLYLSMEARAEVLTVINGELVPGLMQTAEYHRALLDVWPLSDNEAETNQMQLRRERQDAFWRREDAQLHVVMAESALAHRVGSAEVMKAQLEHLRSLADRLGVSVRYIPADSPPHAAMKGGFILIQTAQGVSAYLENIHGSQLLSDPATIRRFQEAAKMVAETSRDIREWR
jgi:hypothetical protein